MTATVTAVTVVTPVTPVDRSTPAGSWVELAACRHRDTRFWFSTPASFETRVAVAVCRSCPVRGECLEQALRWEAVTDGPRFGIFGGLTPTERVTLAAGTPVRMMGS
jgi:WhiB family redox-sensing transcriptional regulator